ncbi:helix-turn-helix transcriptional regulator [Xanthobacter aminoxidans]|uniref:helix-turn-helix transcriptional regulator n=1 Tax=Xanthobacter aminoxidans TaxID=186280 RepID=UPI00372AC033
MPFDVGALDRAVDKFLEVPFHGSGWAPALEAFDAAIGAFGTIILPALNEKMPGPYPVSPSLVPCARQYVEENWIKADIRLRPLKKFVRQGVVTDQDVISREGKRRSPYFQDFIHKNGADEWAGLRADIAGEVCCVSIQRPLGVEPFSPSDLAVLTSIAPRLSMLTSMIQQLDRARLNGLSDALEAMTTPAFLLNRRSEVVRFNTAARSVLNKDISIKDSRLELRGPDDNAFQKRVSDVLRQSGLASPSSGLPLLARREKGRPLLVRAHRLRSDPSLAYFESAWGIVTVTDPDRHLIPATDLLQSTFGLSEREAGLIRLLVQHDGVARDAADAAHISYETFRTHMRNIRAKSGINSIAELIRLATSLRE